MYRDIIFSMLYIQSGRFYCFHDAILQSHRGNFVPHGVELLCQAGGH
jgi:hypothetical protein